MTFEVAKVYVCASCWGTEREGSPFRSCCRDGDPLLLCGCLPNSRGAHRGDCPDFETTYLQRRLR